jgi:hypothetical protein
VSQIIADTVEEIGLKLPPARIYLAEMRRKYYAAEAAQHNDRPDDRAGSRHRKT